MGVLCSAEEIVPTVLWVAGGREPLGHLALKFMTDVLMPYRCVLVQGGATGYDLAAKQLWEDRQLPYVNIPAEWNYYGRPAGHTRNKQMAEGRLGRFPVWLSHLPDLLIAFPGRKGTQSAIDQAKSHNIPVRDLRSGTLL